MSRTALLAVMGAALLVLVGCKSGAGHSVHWGYEGDTGPEHWGDLSTEYQLARTGRRQSPIDLPRVPPAGDVGNLIFDYGETHLQEINNGHSIQVNVAPTSKIEIDGVTYSLLQFHFHHPSEHTVEGRHFAMEVHFVHRSEVGHLAVVGVLLEEGRSHPLIEELWDHMPEEEGKEVVDRSVTLTPEGLLPADRTAIRYDGSLTTPPCSEDVLWHVMVQPVQISAEQIAAFSRIYPNDARPVQPLNGRRIFTVR